ncbi:TonB-dependent siderophore receptor [Brenneria corticis]|nr:TonB-dependent siderophore receptor [Brenneria sp. CFCC 11842]
MLPSPAIFAQSAAAADTITVSKQAEASQPEITENTGSYTVRANSTATKLSLSPRDTPQTTTTITRQQLDDFRLTNANDSLQAGGVSVQRVETDRTYYTVRGFDVNNFQIDGIGLPFTSEEQMGDIDTVLYDHIEVLKGANGLTSTPGNPSATINFVRKRPPREFQGKGSLSYGSWDTGRAELDLSGPLNDAGTLRGRIIGAHQDGNSYLDRYSQKKTIFSGILEADLTDSTTATLGYSEQRNRPKGIMWSALTLYHTDGSPVNYSRSHNTAPDWAYWNTDDRQTFAELTTQWDEGWQSKLTLNYREMTSEGEMFMAGGVPDSQTGLGLTSYASKFDRTERQIFGDANIKGPFELFGNVHEAVFGTSWARTNPHWTSRDDAISEPLPPVGEFNGDFPRPAFANVTSTADYTIYRQNYYAAGLFQITDRFKTLAGVNVSRLRSNGHRLTDSHQYSKSKIIPYFGLLYDINDNYSAYASYTEIFSPQYLLDHSHGLLKPIEGNSIEGGIKGEWLDKRLSATLALFRTEQENTAEYAGFDSDQGFSYYKPVDTISKGAELTLAGQLTPNWQISTGFTRLFSLEDADGNRARTYTPRNQAYLSTTYRVPQIQDLKVGASINWQSDIFREQGASTTGDTIISRQGSYAVFNAMASYDINKNVNLSLNINNLLDRKYLTSLYWAQSYYAPGRNATLSVNVKF